MSKAKPTETQREHESRILRELLMWMRKERIASAHVVVGEVSVQVTLDHRMAHLDEDRKPAEQARQGIVAQYGGALFNPPPPEEDPDNPGPTIQDDDDD